MYKVKRAIIIAAGLGNRLRPVTLETPKQNDILEIDDLSELISLDKSYEKFL